MEKFVYPNGLRLLFERQKGHQSLSCGAWVEVGSRHEPLEIAGVSHFLEHMLFKGTAKRSALQIAQMVDRVGGEFNAFTSREHTCFHILVLGRDLALAGDILSDVVLNSSLKASELERERKVIVQEVAMIEDSPEELAHDLFFEKTYQGHGIGRPVLGNLKSLAKMDRAKIQKFFREQYIPEQMVVSVAGDVSFNEVKRAFARLGNKKAWPGRDNLQSKPQNKSQNRPMIQSGFWWARRPTEQVNILWGVPGVTITAADRFAAFLLNVYLGGGMSSSLFQEIREKNALAYTVYSTLSAFQDTGLLQIYAATSPKHVAKCLGLIEKNVERLIARPIKSRDLQMIKNNLKGSILMGSDHVESRMISLAKNEMAFGRGYTPREVCRLIDQVTIEDISRVAQKLLGVDGRSVLCLGPKPSREMTKAFKMEFVR